MTAPSLLNQVRILSSLTELCIYLLLYRRAQVCPYFLSRDLTDSADLIFMPYNYLVDHQARSQLSGINWSNAVIIIDEAHNIQVLQAAAGELTSDACTVPRAE